MIHKYKIKGTPEVYTIAVNCCSQSGDWEFARNVYDDMTKKGVIPDEVILLLLVFPHDLACTILFFMRTCRIVILLHSVNV